MTGFQHSELLTASPNPAKKKDVPFPIKILCGRSLSATNHRNKKSLQLSSFFYKVPGVSTTVRVKLTSSSTNLTLWASTFRVCPTVGIWSIW